MKVVTTNYGQFCSECGASLCVREIRKNVCYDCTLRKMGIDPSTVEPAS